MMSAHHLRGEGAVLILQTGSSPDTLMFVSTELGGKTGWGYRKEMRVRGSQKGDRSIWERRPDSVQSPSRSEPCQAGLDPRILLGFKDTPWASGHRSSLQRGEMPQDSKGKGSGDQLVRL